VFNTNNPFTPYKQKQEISPSTLKFLKLTMPMTPQTPQYCTVDYKNIVNI